MGPGKKNLLLLVFYKLQILTNQIINLQVKSDWLDGAKDVRRYDFMAAAIRLETMMILLLGYGCQM